MHTYTANTKDRESIPKYLILTAITTALCFNYLVQFFRIPIPWFIGSPAVAAFYGIIYWLFDNFLWRWRFGSITPFSQIPDLRGTWAGKINSSFQNTEVQVVVYIRQTWSKLSIELESDSSKSYTIMAALNIEAGYDSGLRYEYRNEPKQYGKTPEHRGSAHLNISPYYSVLEGKYYTSEGSKNRGKIVLHFLDRKLYIREDALKKAKSLRYIN